MAGELANIAAAIPHNQTGCGRNATVNRAAYKLGRLIDPLTLDDGHIAQVTCLLIDAARATGLGEREARTAVASGLAQGRANPRRLDLQPAHHRLTGRRPRGHTDPTSGPSPRARRPVDHSREGRS